MGNPLDYVTQDQSGDDAPDLARAITIRPVNDMPNAAPSTDNRLMQAIAPQPADQADLGTLIGRLRDRLLGTGGQGRYQLWPERMVREGLSAPGDVLARTTPSTSESLIEPAQQVAALSGGGALTERPGVATLGSGPVRPTMKPVEPAPVFYSALEHAANNAAQDVMTPDQWRGFLKNQPGVKKEELDWTGLDDWLKGQKGKVSKSDVQSYLDEHKTEIKDVTKGADTVDEAYLHDTVEEYMDSARGHFYDEHQRDPTPHEEEALRSEIMEDLRENPVDYDEDIGGTKYSNYQLPGGENYREHLLTLPPKGRAISKAERDQIDSDFENGYLSDEEYEHKLAGFEKDNTGNYVSSHWDEPNVLAHVRINDRMLEDPGFRVINRKSNNASGHFNTREEAEAYQVKLPESVRGSTGITDKSVKPVKSLHIEEIQSDWHQQGRKSGYKGVDAKPVDTTGWTTEKTSQWGKGDDVMNVYTIKDKDGNVLSSEHSAKTPEEAIENTRRYQESSLHNKAGVPDAPFKTSWPELALKRMIRHAAENGYDRISWTPGEAQAARYDLSKQIQKLELTHNRDGVGELILTPKKEGVQQRIPVPIKSRDDLVNAVGKDLADKLYEQGSKNNGKAMLEGLDLKVGGEGLREFYDKMLPKMAEKIGKAHGVKVKQAEIPITEGAEHDTTSVHYFDLPQSLKDHALHKGFPLYMSGIPFPLTPVDHDPFEKKKGHK